MSYGWLGHMDFIARDELWFKIPLDPELPTRWEEFSFVQGELRKRSVGKLIDLGCGFEPKVHIMPQIASMLGYTVEAVDLRPPQLGFPIDANIARVYGNITDLNYPNNVFDAAICISTLEHFSAENKIKTTIEAWRILKPGGTLIITMDEQEPEIFVDIFGKALFDFGDRVDDPEQHLDPHVSFLVGDKR